MANQNNHNNNNKQQSTKNDKKHRKLTKSPQVSCDLPMLSSSPIQCSGGGSFPSPSPKYIAYPSSFPSHLDDECFKKNFEYLRSDVSVTSTPSPSPPHASILSATSSSGAIITSTTTAAAAAAATTSPLKNRSDDSAIFHRYPSISLKNVEVHKNFGENTIKCNDATIMPMNNKSSLSSAQSSSPNQKPNFLHLINPVTIPACCLKQHNETIHKIPNSQVSPITVPPKPPPSSTSTTTTIITTPISTISNTSTTTVPPVAAAATTHHPSTFNDHLRNLKQMFHSSSSSSTSSVQQAITTTSNSTTTTTLTSPKNNNQKSHYNSNTTKNNLNKENINHNPFIFGNIFNKTTTDKSTSTTAAVTTILTTTSSASPTPQITTPTQAISHPPPPTMSSSSTTSTILSGCLGGGGNIKNNSNPFLCENIKRDEFLKATMKICLVVSPPSNKLLQLKSKSLTYLDALESHISTQTDDDDYLSPKPNADYLEVQSTTNTLCCKPASSPPSSSSITTAAAAAAAASSSKPCSIKKKSPSLRSNKKPVLTRSEVSSSEYFCVYYDIDNGYNRGEEEFIPATKGVTLAEALYSALNRRNLSFSQITISDNNFPSSMDLGTPPYSGGVNKNTDVGNLAGKCLIVTEKENSKKSGHYSLQKAASFGARQRPAKLFQSASTEETTELTDQKTAPSATNKQPKQRWSVLFGLKNPQQNQLCEILNHYAKNGVPQSRLICSFEHVDLLQALDYLENIHSSWMEFVCYPDMTDNEIKIQSAIWELVTTEVDYIHALQTVTDLFLACLEAIQSEHLLTDVDQNKLFSNIRDICEANIKFWTMYIFPMVRHSINTGHPMCVDYFQPGFLTFATTCAPYKKYCAEQSTCQFYCKELHRNNALFQAYLAWCEAQKLCNRLRLADILVRPMQRLTKYSLLLTAIRKHITDENDGEIMDAMIHSVENFVCSVNSHLTTRQENERLKGIMARIESYDVVDSNNENLDKMAKQYSSMFDLCGPMKGCATTQGRHLFMEGDLKFKDNINKVDVHCFLLTDILLVCKTIAKKGLGTLKVIRQPFLTDRLVIKVKENTLYSIYLNEFNVAVTAFTLQCPEAKSWHDAITKAKHIYTRLKQGSSWDGYNIKYGNSAEMLGVKKSPLNSSIGSRVSSLNNSHSGSVELTESKNVSVDFEKTNSLSSDESMSMHGVSMKKVPQNSPTKFKSTTSNTLVVQPLHHLGQSLPNLNLNPLHISNNTLLVPGTQSTSNSQQGNNLLSPSHRGISYPPPSPTRATLRRGFAFSSSIKNPPLVKSRNITSQNSFNLLQTQQIVAPPTPSGAVSLPSTSSLDGGGGGGGSATSITLQTQSAQSSTPATTAAAQLLLQNIEQNLQHSHESDV